MTRTLAVDLVAGDQFLSGDNGARDVVVTVLEPLRELGRKDSLGRTFPSISARREDTGQVGEMMFGPGGGVWR